MSDPTSGNQILAALPAETLRSLCAEEVDYDAGATLYRADETPHAVYFPHRGAVVSIVRSTENGSMVESGMIGDEGLLSIPTLLDEPRPTGSEAIVQIPGRLSVIGLEAVRARFHADGALRDPVLLFTNCFLDQVSQNLVCNRLHDIERRLAKWLLLARDRTDHDELTLTQEFLSHMLGVHRPGVSIAIGALTLDHVIEQGRNRIRIIDREGLEQRSCECYVSLCRGLVQLRSALAARSARGV